ncbi:hypothetical protein JOC74_003244 [Bacillus capparidis]|uniref:Secreted protein n=1 Tax=Bacillus capparidis TaxID=1840411 RepID=A0ABS4CZF2_9BACI|nr:hypothetical protein [Bacillus capparidis]
MLCTICALLLYFFLTRYLTIKFISTSSLLYSSKSIFSPVVNMLISDSSLYHNETAALVKEILPKKHGNTQRK